MGSIADLRESYGSGELLEANMLADPIEQFRAWFTDAQSAGIEEPNAMSLATADSTGRPNVRTVLLKGVDTGFVFFTNYDSTKARELEADPRAALCFHWKEIERQVRVIGSTGHVSRDESDEYFHSRPRGSQIAAWASPQSSVVSDRAELDRLFAEAERRFEGGDVPLPDFWGGYRLIPDVMEFWQGRANRLHDRILYEKVGAGWKRKRLAP